MTHARIDVDANVIDDLLDIDVTVDALMDRHPDVFAGQMWKELRSVLYRLRIDVGSKFE